MVGGYFSLCGAESIPQEYPRPEAGMPYKEDMNWDEGKKRWHRKYKGTMYRVVPATLDDDKTLPRVMVYSRDGSRAAANEWWRRKEADLEGRPARVRGRIEE